MPQHHTLKQPKRPWRVLDWNARNAICHATFANKDKAIAKAQGLANQHGESFYVRNDGQVFKVDPEPEYSR